MQTTADIHTLYREGGALGARITGAYNALGVTPDIVENLVRCFTEADGLEYLARLGPPKIEEPPEHSGITTKFITHWTQSAWPKGHDLAEFTPPAAAATDPDGGQALHPGQALG